jgi:hypothetical protein
LPRVAPDRVTQQVDILPSLLDYLGIRPDRRLLFGSSLFRQGEGWAFFRESGCYWLVRGNRALEFVPGKPSRLFDPGHDPQLKTPLTNEPDRLSTMEYEAKARIQYFNNGLMDRELYDRVKPEGSSDPISKPDSK